MSPHPNGTNERPFPAYRKARAAVLRFIRCYKAKSTLIAVFPELAPSLNVELYVKSPARAAHPIHVLLVDDNLKVRRQLKLLLSGADQSFDICGEAVDGREAIEKARELKPDAVVMDLALPVLDGLSAAREIGKLSHRAAVIMYTMYSSRRLEAEARAAGILRVVSKPATSELIAALRDCVRGQQRGSGGPAG